MKKFLLLMLVCAPVLADDSLLTCRAIKEANARLACYDGLAIAPVATRPVATTMAAAPAVAAPTRKEQEQAFGLAAKPSPVTQIESVLPGKFEGWGPNTQFTLANGQVWRVADDSSAVVYGTNLKVTLERGSFGTTFMIIEGTNRSPKVKRLQ
ncbi:MAG: hypothetical protein ACJ8GW_05485 [Massilia sp.]